MFAVAFGCQDTDLVDILVGIGKRSANITVQHFPDPQAPNVEVEEAPQISLPPRRRRKRYARTAAGKGLKEVLMESIIKRKLAIITSGAAIEIAKENGLNPHSVYQTLKNLVQEEFLVKIDTGSFAVLNNQDVQSST